MENFYEELYQYLIERGIDDDEATEVVNYLYEDNIHEYGLITENKGRAFLNVLKAVGYMSGVLKKPGAKKAVKQVVQKVQGTPLQGNLLTKAREGTKLYWWKNTIYWHQSSSCCKFSTSKESIVKSRSTRSDENPWYV